MTPEGMISGLYSAVVPGHMAVAIADSGDCLLFTPPLSAVPIAVKDAQEFLAGPGKVWVGGRGATPTSLPR
jgi:hypothetical protein